MALTAKGANGVLASPAATLYTAPASTTAYVLSIFLQNNDIDSVEVQLSTVRGASTKSFFFGYFGPIGRDSVEDIIVLQAGQSIIGFCDPTAAINFDISVLEET